MELAHFGKKFLDELLKTIAWVRTNGNQGVTGNE